MDFDIIEAILAEAIWKWGRETQNKWFTIHLVCNIYEHINSQAT